MPDVRTAPVKAQLVEDIDAVRAQPGAFEFYVDHGDDGSVAGMIYCCPCGCGVTGALAFRPRPSPSWEWDGNRHAPTLSPSVHHVGHWHGWLRNGIWESC